MRNYRTPHKHGIGRGGLTTRWHHGRNIPATTSSPVNIHHRQNPKHLGIDQPHPTRLSISWHPCPHFRNVARHNRLARARLTGFLSLQYVSRAIGESHGLPGAASRNNRVTDLECEFPTGLPLNIRAKSSRILNQLIRDLYQSRKLIKLQINLTQNGIGIRNLSALTSPTYRYAIRPPRSRVIRRHRQRVARNRKIIDVGKQIHWRVIKHQLKDSRSEIGWNQKPAIGTNAFLTNIRKSIINYPVFNRTIHGHREFTGIPKTAILRIPRIHSPSRSPHGIRICIRIPVARSWCRNWFGIGVWIIHRLVIGIRQATVRLI